MEEMGNAKAGESGGFLGFFLEFGKTTEEMGNAKAGGIGGFLVFHTLCDFL